MTTIVFDGKVLCSDGRVTRGNSIIGKRDRKVFKAENENGETILIATAGTAADGELFKTWALKGRKAKHKVWDPEDMEAVIMIDCEEGLLIEAWFGAEHPIPLEPPFALGSGAEYAMGALMAGATAQEAIKIAASLDVFTDDNITGYQREIDGWTPIS